MLQKSKQDCCGCSACFNICPQNAIDMLPDALGFKYPIIDESKCIECGLCEKVCSFNPNYAFSDNEETYPSAFAVRHKSLDELRLSRSGAYFMALASYFVSNGGVVYGVAIDETNSVKHIRVTDIKSIKLLKGSKYVQSEIGNIFSLVKNDLASGKKVLFSGTGCQVAGLKSYIDRFKLTTNLYLVDIVCHGVQSPKFLSDFISYQESKYHGVLKMLNFRDKTRVGWSGHEESFYINGRKHYSSLYKDVFYSHLLLRESCFNCHYCNYNRPGDITLADYWGWERTDPAFNSDNAGCSLVLINSRKGSEMFDKTKDDVFYIRARLENTTQGHFFKATTKPENMDVFCALYLDKGFLTTLKSYKFISCFKSFLQLKRRFALKIENLLHQ